MRDRRILEGQLVEVLPADEPTSEEALTKYYRAQPFDLNYEILRKPVKVDRYVLLRGDPEDSNYIVIQKQPFHKVIEQ